MSTGALIGSLNSTRDRMRGSDGKYTKHPMCDGCGKPCTEHFTDDRVCGGGDGPGFYLCNRKRCVAKRAKVEAVGGLEALRAFYHTQRVMNQGPYGHDETQEPTHEDAHALLEIELRLPDTSPLSTIDQFRQIVETRSIGKVNGVLVDLFSANTVVQVYDHPSVTPELRAKLDKLTPHKLIAVAFRAVK